MVMVTYCVDRDLYYSHYYLKNTEMVTTEYFYKNSILASMELFGNAKIKAKITEIYLTAKHILSAKTTFKAMPTK